MLLVTFLVKTKLISLLCPTSKVSFASAVVTSPSVLEYQSVFNSEWNSSPSGKVSIILPTFPASSPLFVATILYSIITVAPSTCFEFISNFANCLSL